VTSEPGAAFDRLWAALAPVGRGARGGYRRFAWTAADAELREWFAAECAVRGLPAGVSHSPAEHAERDDCLAGVAALAKVLTVLALAS
jgi:acetylornithine deacetylase/succinyl-diaminopimelate desuccinylase-like protein